MTIEAQAELETKIMNEMWEIIKSRPDETTTAQIIGILETLKVYLARKGFEE